MKRWCCLLLVACLFGLPAGAQKISREELQKNMYQPLGKSVYNWLDWLRRAQPLYKVDSVLKRFSQRVDENIGLANYNFGNQDSAYVYFARTPYKLPLISQAVAPDSVRAEAALDFLVEQAKGQQIVIISEAHHLPPHRAFTAKLLTRLRAQGFAYFGAEMYDMADSLMNKRGYPLATSLTDLYNEPHAQLMTRTALQQGYRVFGYEDWSDTQVDSSFARYGLRVDNPQKQRDWIQAINIYKQTFASDKAAKIILHVGYDHILEKETRRGNMAHYLSILTGINPLTIAQHPEAQHNIADYTKFCAEMSPDKQPFVLLNRFTNSAWRTERYADLVDWIVFHPRMPLDKFDARHLAYEQTRKPSHQIQLKKMRLAYPCLLEVFLAEEYKDEARTPIYSVEICDANEARKVLKLYLPAGKKIRVRAVSATGEVLAEPK